MHGKATGLWVIVTNCERESWLTSRQDFEGLVGGKADYWANHMQTWVLE